MLSGVTALMGIRTRLTLARLLFVTDAGDGLGDLVAAACRGGADAVGLKDADLAQADALWALGELRRAAQARQALIVWHGSPAVAGEFGADALVLGDDADAPDARRVLSGWAVVGRSCNSTDEVDAALADPAVDFLLVGPGLDHIRHAAERAPQADPSSKPWFAAGGVTERTLDVVLRAGALRVAVGRSIREADDPEAAARALADRLREAWASTPGTDAVTDSAFGDGPRIGLPPAEGRPPATDLTL